MVPLTVIIPSRNAANLTACVRAVRLCEREVRIIAVEDGVSLGNCGADLTLRGVAPFVFARNCNVAIKYAAPSDVVLLNDDALLEMPGGFSRLRMAASMYPQYGLIGAVTNSVGNANQRLRGTGDLRHEEHVVCFVCVYIPRRTLIRVGLLDERFVTYGWEDNDYCRRVQAAGLKLGIHDGVFVDHATLRSEFRGTPGTSGDIEPGRRIFEAKWGAA